MLSAYEEARLLAGLHLVRLQIRHQLWDALSRSARIQTASRGGRRSGLQRVRHHFQIAAFVEQRRTRQAAARDDGQGLEEAVAQVIRLFLPATGRVPAASSADASPSWRSHWHPEGREVDLGVDGSQRVDAVPEGAYLRADRRGLPAHFSAASKARAAVSTIASAAAKWPGSHAARSIRAVSETIEPSWINHTKVE